VALETFTVRNFICWVLIVVGVGLADVCINVPSPANISC
jgi:hypothetical protein